MSRHDSDSALRSIAPAQSGARVIIVSNVLLYRNGLAASLARDGKLDVVATCKETDLERALSAQDADAILIDASTRSSLEVARRLRAHHPHLRLVGFGISGAASDMVACAEAGLAAFIDRDSNVDELVTAVEGALRGELRCSPRLVAQLCNRLALLAEGHSEPDAELTRRERQVAALITQGLSNKEIAKDLRIGPATVKNHVHNILEKLKVRRRAAIAGCFGRSPGSEVLRA